MADVVLNGSLRTGEGGRVPVDSTLSIAGQAADAKAVGDALKNFVDTSDLYDVESSLGGRISGIDVRLAAAEGQISALDTLKASILAAVYPVGSYFISESAMPSDIAAIGSWTQVEDRVLIGSGSRAVGTIGGAETVTHNHNGMTGETTLTEAQIPMHTHGQKTIEGWFNATAYVCSISKTLGAMFASDGVVCKTDLKKSSQRRYPSSVSKVSAASENDNTVGINVTHEHTPFGGNQAHAHTIGDAVTSTMQPFRAVNIWRRTA